MTSKRADRKDRRRRRQKRAQGFGAGADHLEQLVGEYVDELHLFGPAEFEQKVEESRRAVAAAGLKVPDWQVRRFAEREWSIAPTPPPAPLRVSSPDPAAELRRPIIKGGGSVTSRSIGLPAVVAELVEQLGEPDGDDGPWFSAYVRLLAAGARGFAADGVMHPIARYVAGRVDGAVVQLSGDLLVVERAGVTARVELTDALVNLVEQLDMFPERFPALLVDTYGGL